jgi:catechol 2,3-dioxygenase-like lactoylglutathione lyase family enzyme
MYHQERFIQLTTPDCNDILVFEEKKNNVIGKTGGIAHFGFRLRDPNEIDEIVDNVKKAGGTIIDRGEFLPGSPYVFFKDLDGYEVEVWYELLQ